MKRTGTSRRKTRHKFQKSAKEKGRINIQKYLQKFKEGDRVLLKLDPSIHKGMYFRRHHGKIGIITGKRGFCYKTKVKDNKKEKTLIIHPVHLTKVEILINR